MEAPVDMLARLTRDFESQFAHVTQVSSPPVEYLIFQPHGPSTEVRVQLEHRDPTGNGLTAEEAIADWQAKLPHGEFACLVWRARPEIVSERDFDMKVTRWRVWSRFALADKQIAA